MMTYTLGITLQERVLGVMETLVKFHSTIVKMTNKTYGIFKNGQLL